MKRRQRRQSAFTLLEIMLVVAIIGVLLAVAISKMAPALDVAKGTRTKADISSIRTRLLSYNGANGFYPFGARPACSGEQARKRAGTYILETVDGGSAKGCLGFARIFTVTRAEKQRSATTFFQPDQTGYPIQATTIGVTNATSPAGLPAELG